MGLDVSAYSGSELVEVVSCADEYENKYPYTDSKEFIDFVYGDCVSRHDDFSNRAPEIVPNGVYRSKEKFTFRAGSYSGYNNWREWLSMTINHLSPQTVWNDPSGHSMLPFFELINFSDCEGVIGTAQSAKLLIDFETYQDKVNNLDCDNWYKEMYSNWKHAFRLAATCGYVLFH